AIGQHLRPCDVAVAFHHRVRAAALEGFLRIESGVDAAEDHEGSAFPHHAAESVSAQRISGMNPDSDDVARLNPQRIELLERFVTYLGIAIGSRRGRCNDIQPPGSDYG